jgi:DNA invertase Pin-like site-specific DNA recombinase
MSKRRIPKTTKNSKRKANGPKGASVKQYRPGSVSAAIVPLLSKYRNTVIARMVGCSSELVRRIRLKTRIPVPIDKALQDKIANIRRMTKAGLAAPEIAEGLGIKSATIHTIARKHGIKVIKGIPGAPPSFDLNELKTLLAKGSTFCSAARTLGVGYTTIFRWAKRLGLKSVRSISRRDL